VQREAVVLFEVDGYSIEEIAAMQRVSVSAVKSRLVRGRERLRRYYERQGWAAETRTSDSSIPEADAQGAPREKAGAAS
jgi:RNA polymerase sigma-70 factor (ECF subfamily)